MSLINSLLKNIVLPSSDLLLGQSISKDLRFLMKSQWWKRVEINEYQNTQLQKLLKHSYENVPYYNALFRKLRLTPEDIKTKEDLSKLPILTKEDVRKNFPEKIIATNLSKAQLVLQHSSGSTGEPLQYYVTRASMSFKIATGIRAWYWMNYKLGDSYIKISARPRSSIFKKAQDFLNNSNYIYFEDLAENIFVDIISRIQSIDAKFIRSYPLPLYYLSGIIEKRGGIGLTNLKEINTTGSTLHPYMRNRIEKIFNVSIHDSYSCEGGANFAQCETIKYYHPSEEYAISEFLDDDFTKNDEEHSKRHITTDLSNYATPFIRYDTQDYVVLGKDENCSCRREYLNILKIKGRDSDILYLPDGRYILEYAFYKFFESISLSIKQYQIYQETANLISIKLVVNKLFNEKIKNNINEYFSRLFGPEIKLFLDIVDEIKLTPTGKRRIIIRNPEIKIPSGGIFNEA